MSVARIFWCSLLACVWFLRAQASGCMMVRRLPIHLFMQRQTKSPMMD